MNQHQIHKKADELWHFFENNIFVNNGQYSYNTNLVFSFADYIDSLSDEDLADFLQCSQNCDVKLFRKILNDGVDKWLHDFAKTLAIM